MDTSQNLEAKIRVLNEIKAGKRPPKDLKNAIDSKVVRSASLRSEAELVSAMLKCLDKEKEKLAQLVEQREEQIEKLKNEQTRFVPENNNSAEQPAPKKMDEVYKCIDALVSDHLAMPLSIPKEQIQYSQQIVRRLMEVSLKGEQLIVPENTLIVNYLVECGLVRCEKVGLTQLRVRLN